MEGYKRFAIQSLIAILIVNTMIMSIMYALAGRTLAVFGVGAFLTLVLWFILVQGSKRVLEARAPEPAPVAPAPEPVKIAPPKPTKAAPGPALQLLSILQRKGRLIDFLQEDLSAYQDDQIGAAVRNIHEGCKQALAEYVTLEPIYTENEGSRITVEPGFDAHAIRLTGNIVGDPPFKGALRHRGWRVSHIELPERVPDEDAQRIIAAAEVEVGT